MTRPSDSNGFIAPPSKVEGLLDLARNTLDEKMSARQEAGLLRFEQTIARRTLRAGETGRLGPTDSAWRRPRPAQLSR